MSRYVRDYEDVIARLSPGTDREEAMTAVVDALWASLNSTGVSWVGFYIDHPDEPEDRRLTLGPHRDKPACSPLGLHGVCGRALVERRCWIVEDVAALGDAYVACDPRDRSEIVIPLTCGGGVAAPWGVLDLDSWDVGAFDKTDERGLCRVLAAAGLL